MLKPWLNEGLLLSSGMDLAPNSGFQYVHVLFFCFKGSKWQTRRKLLTSAFHFKSIDLYNRSVNSHSRVLAKKLLEACNKNEKIDIKEYVTLCSLDILCGDNQFIFVYSISYLVKNCKYLICALTITRIGYKLVIL